jgi:hypothetical protein
MMGKRIHHGALDEAIDVSFLSPGAYVLTITKEGSVIQTSKVVKSAN